MADHRDKGAFQLLRLAKMGDIPNRCNDVEQHILRCYQGCIPDTDRQSPSRCPVQIPFSVEGSRTRERPAARFGLFQSLAVLQLRPADHLFVSFSLDLRTRCPQHLGKRWIAPLDDMTRCQDEDPVCNRIEQCADPLLLLAELGV